MLGKPDGRGTGRLVFGDSFGWREHAGADAPFKFVFPRPKVGVSGFEVARVGPGDIRGGVDLGHCGFGGPVRVGTDPRHITFGADSDLSRWHHESVDE